MNPDIINSIVTFIVGLFAFYLYWRKGKDEKQAAATIIIMDIRHAEQVVLSLLEKGVVDRTMKNILHDNNWAKYKHLFAGKFSQDDFGAFNRFFDACIEISDARNRMLELFYSSAIAKAEIYQQKIFLINPLSSPEGQSEKIKIFQEINSDDSFFDPDEPKRIIIKNLQLIGRLSNSAAFDRLKKIADIN
jgi:hypothetical protein